MHEWALAEAILATAKQISEKENLKEITEVTVMIGQLQDVERRILRFAIKETKSDFFQKTKFHFLKSKTTLKCRVCGASWKFKKESLDKTTLEAIHFVPEVAHTYIKCPKCKSPDFEISSGRGVWIQSVKGVKNQ